VLRRTAHLCAKRLARKVGLRLRQKLTPPGPGHGYILIIIPHAPLATVPVPDSFVTITSAPAGAHASDRSPARGTYTAQRGRQAYAAAASVPPSLWHVLAHLPPAFSVDDLVDLSEQLQLEVFVVFHDLRTLIHADLIQCSPSGFEQTPTCRYLTERFTP